MFGSRWKIAFDFECAIIAFPFRISAKYFMPKEKEKSKKEQTKKRRQKLYFTFCELYFYFHLKYQEHSLCRKKKEENR